MSRTKNIGLKILVFLLVVVAYIVSLFFTKQIEALFNKSSSNINSIDVEIKDEYIQVHYIDVGQGDSTVIELSNNKIIMIDTGTKSSATQLTNYLDTIIFDRASYNNTIDYLILTHTDSDHIGGAIDILTKYEVKTVYRPNETVPTTSNIWQNTVTAINENAQHIIYNEKDLSIEYDDPNSFEKDYKLTFYAPIQESFPNNNDYSPFIIFETYSKRFMFTGDASSEIEKEVLDYYKNDLSVLDIDVLKAGHHGSKYSNSEEFLNVTTPDYSIISCGEDNNYGHPHNETINRLQAVGSQIFRTDINGTILAFIDDKGELYFIANYFEPNSYYIEWWYVGLTIVVVVGAGLFVRKYTISKNKRTDTKRA